MQTLRGLMDGEMPVPSTPIEVTALSAMIHESHTQHQQNTYPTPDLVLLERGGCVLPPNITEGFLVHCADTEDTWWAPTLECLNTNFIYREDISIHQITSVEEANSWYCLNNAGLLPGVETRRSCYLLDNPATETYEPYYRTSYPLTTYGQTTPKGCTILKFPDRFQRDQAILELERKYSSSSAKAASNMTLGEIPADKAIVVSDGSLVQCVSSCAFVYMDADSVLKQVEGFVPSDPEQAVLLSEIQGAFNALSMCYARKKYNILYYYDNTTILDVWRKKRLDYLYEVRRFKNLCATMDAEGYSIEFIEIHPKSSTPTDDNKAMAYFHNLCDADCGAMSLIFRRDYRSHAASDKKRGVALKNVRGVKK